MSETAFTEAQLAAADIERRDLETCIVAGPGSGKTTVLVEYFRRLVEAGVDPLRILAITFTEKAAGNMRSKLATAFGEDSAMRARLERAWVSTIHGFCARLLRENAVFAGVDPEFYVADERESWRLQQESLEAALDEMFAARPEEMSALIRGLSSNRFEEAMLSAYDGMRSAGVGVEQLGGFPALPGVAVEEIGDTLVALEGEPPVNWSYTQKEQYQSALETGAPIVMAGGTLEALRATGAFACNRGKCKRNNRTYDLLTQLQEQVDTARLTLATEHYASERRLLLDIFHGFNRIYRERKRRAGALDFADLEEFSVGLLEGHAETREGLRAQFDHILMDEFQDTNGQQARLMRLVRAPDRFYAVGDINQSIFGFRHAEPRGFEDYRKEVERSGRRLVELADNFRSRPEILSAVETILDGREGVERRDLLARREFDAEREVSVEAIYTPSGEREEAQLVGQRILELTRAGEFAFEDVAVLVRNTEVLAAFTGAFDRAGIPYVVNRGKGFYESREVNDLVHLLRTIANPRDEISLATVLRSPLVGVSDEALLRLRVLGENNVKNIGAALMGLDDAAAAAFDASDAERLLRFRDRLREWRMRREYVTFDRLLLAAIDDCGYPAAPNLDKFLGQARNAAARMSLDEFVAELALVRASNPREPDAPPEDSSDTVKIMTVHSAKGLEFPVVFVAALHKGINTDLASVEFSREYGLGVSWRDPAGGKDIDDLAQSAIREEREAREKAESHRLLYVAMTRAEELLVLSFAGRKQNWAKVVVSSLNLDIGTDCDEVLLRHAPDGKAWHLRWLVADSAGELAPLAPASAPVVYGGAGFQPGVGRHRVPAPQQHDTNATVTAISAFAACPRRYYLGWYLGFEGRMRKPVDAEADHDLPAGEFGTQVHMLLADNPVDDPDPEAVRLAEVFRQSALGRRAARAARTEREFDFLLAVEDLVIRGQVDLWFEESGELVIVDYKTDAVTAHEAHRRAEDYSLQLRLYATAVERAAGRPPDRAFLHFLRPNTIVPVDLTPSLLESPEQTVRDLLSAQDRLEFPLNEGEHCRRCPFWRGLCPARV